MAPRDSKLAPTYQCIPVYGGRGGRGGGTETFHFPSILTTQRACSPRFPIIGWLTSQAFLVSTLSRFSAPLFLFRGIRFTQKLASKLEINQYLGPMLLLVCCDVDTELASKLEINQYLGPTLLLVCCDVDNAL